MDLFASNLDAAADTLELRTCVVRKLILANDTAIDLVCNLHEGRERRKIRIQQILRCILPFLLPVGLDAVNVVQ